jgi:hypothetical protein
MSKSRNSRPCGGLWIVSCNAVAWIWPNAGALLHLSWKLRNEITALVFASGAGTTNYRRQTVRVNSGVLRRQNESAEWRTEMAQAERVGALEDHCRRGGGRSAVSASPGLPDWVPGSIYLPYAQAGTLDGRAIPAMTLVVGTQSDTAQFRNALREAAEAEAPNAPVGQVRRLDEMVAEMSDDFRSIMRVFLSFAVTAVVLAAIGIYGLMSYWVSQRTYEIGLRVAMGASRGQIARMIYGQGLSVASYGIVAGLAAAWLATRFLASLLFGVAPTDAATFVSAAALITGVACLAVSLPAWRATRIDPIRALRAD